MRRAEKPITDTIKCLVCGKELHSLGGHLRVHGMTAAEYKEEFGVDHIVPPQLRKCISDARLQSWGKSTKSSYQPMDREQIIECVLDLADKGESLQTEEMKRCHADIYCQAVYMFNSWREVLAAAGLPLPESREVWTDERILTEIRAIGDGSMSMACARRDNPKLVDAAIKHFGNWKTAVEKAGFDYAKVKQTRDLSDDDILEQLADWVREHGPLVASKLNPTLYYHARTRFGSLESAAKAAELPFGSPRWTREKLLKELQKERDSGQRMNAYSLMKRNMALYAAASRHFGSYQNALDAMV